MITTIAMMLAATVAVANGESKLRSNTAAQDKAKGVVINPPAQCMSARTGRTKDINQKQILGARAHFTNANVANLQCCKDNNGKVEGKRMMYGHGGNYCNVIDAAGTKKDGGMKWVEANNACANAPDGPWRLCTDKEVREDVGAYKGCNFDNKNVWTSTKWADVAKGDRATDWATRINVRNCQDFGECLKKLDIWGPIANKWKAHSCCDSHDCGYGRAGNSQGCTSEWKNWCRSNN
jgi:hypothetical protein